MYSWWGLRKPSALVWDNLPDVSSRALSPASEASSTGQTLRTDSILSCLFVCLNL